MVKNIGKNISNKYSQKLVDSAIKSGAPKVATDVIKTASKRAIQKTAEETGDLIGNKIADKITSISRKYEEFPQNETNNEGDLLVILIDCMIFLSPFLDVTRMSMSTVPFLAQLDSGILCL